MITNYFQYKKTVNLPLDNVLDVGYAKEKLYKKNIFYIRKKPNKIFVNFFYLESKYKK